MGALKVVALLVVGAGLIYWAVNSITPAPTQALRVDPEGQVASALPAIEDGSTTLTGIVIYTGVEPPVPYIQYTFTEGEVRTKQLIYVNERGCSPSSGDLPCLTVPDDQYPQVPYGSTVRVTGVVEGDQILVESLEVL